jgi:hypothetical protein
LSLADLDRLGLEVCLCWGSLQVRSGVFCGQV